MRREKLNELIELFKKVSENIHYNESVILGSIFGELRTDIEKTLWISCSDSLPTTDGRFEVTIKGSKGKRYVEMSNYHKESKGLNKWSNENVIAWRQRAEPYKEVIKC